MSLLGLAARNLGRNKLRSWLTVAGTAVAVLTFILLRTVVWSWNSASQYSDQGRVVSRHKVTFVMSLPKKYVEQTAAVKGVKEVSWANWFGGKDPRPQFEHEFFATLACDPKTTLEVYPEYALPPEQRDNWFADKQGVIVGETLAKKLGYKVGDKVRLDSAIYPCDWQFNIDGIYHATKKSVDNSTLFFHWDYLNDSRPEARKDQVGWIVSRIEPGASSADVAKAIDATFDVQDTQTLSQDEGSFQHSFMGGMSAVLSTMDVISIVILVIMVLILANTVAMGARERTSEYGVLRAIGFLPGDIAWLVIGEATVLGIAGGIAGLGISVLFVNGMMGRWIEENVSFFPYFRVVLPTALLSLALAVVLGLLSGIFPAWQSSKLKVVDALRRVA